LSATIQRTRIVREPMDRLLTVLSKVPLSRWIASWNV